HQGYLSDFSEIPHSQWRKWSAVTSLTLGCGMDSAGRAAALGLITIENRRQTVYNTSMKHTKTLKVRVRDKHAPLLRQMARSVNFVWNYMNELSHRSIRERGVFLSAFDL